MWDPFNIESEGDDPRSSEEEASTICFDCGEKNQMTIDESYGTMVCGSCGVVNCDLIDKQSDQTAALSEGSSINFYLPRSSLGTSISGAARMKIRLVNEWWKWVYKEKSFFDDKKEIEAKCTRAGFTQAVVDNALNLYKRVSELRHSDGKNAGKYVIIRGTNRRAIMAASVYYGAKLQRQPRSPKEVADVFELEMGQMTRGCKRFVMMVDLTPLLKSSEKSEAYDYVDSLCYRLNLDKDIRNQSLDVIRNAQKLQLATNHQPPAVAASTLLLVMESQRGKILKGFRTELSHVLKVSEVTINKTVKELQPWIRILSNNTLVETYLKDIIAAES